MLTRLSIYGCAAEIQNAFKHVICQALLKSWTPQVILQTGSTVHYGHHPAVITGVQEIAASADELVMRSGNMLDIPRECVEAFWKVYESKIGPREFNRDSAIDALHRGLNLVRDRLVALEKVNDAINSLRTL